MPSCRAYSTEKDGCQNEVKRSGIGIGLIS